MKEVQESSVLSRSRTSIAIFLVLMVLVVVLLVCLLKLPKQEKVEILMANCPDKAQPLDRFLKFPQGRNIILNGGNQYLLETSVDVNTIEITDGATLVVSDNGNPIKIRTKYILIMNSGSMLIGSESCPYMSPLEIALYGKSDDTEFIDGFGRKFIGVASTGSLDIHGPWKLSWTYLTTTIQPGTTDAVIDLADIATSWKAGDMIVIASSNYDMNQAERFTLLNCSTCSSYQVKIKDPVKYTHLGEITREGVDMRAEVGLLTRNIKIYGEMEQTCYLNNHCQYFDYDTFGGHTKVLVGAVNARFEGIELYNMGQQILASYPIHFHRLDYAQGKYARQLSIHDCFSRCVTLHAVQGIVVEDVVGYNTLGHCFFLEDGNEVDNTLRHNLGLVTKAGTLLPSDRNDVMCRGLTANSNVYIPNPDNECKSVSTFWISHPANTLVNNSAGGSEHFGFYYALYHEPTGPSAGSLPAFHAERSPLGSCVGNRAHSNPKAGFLLNHGVKTTLPSAEDPRDILAIVDEGWYAPHLDRNLSQPRVKAIIEDFIGYKNFLGLFARGGEISVQSARFADNDIAVILASSSSLPYDVGSHQELIDSIVVGRTSRNDEWKARSGPCVGFQIQDGPITLLSNQFYSFSPTSERLSYALGFLPNNTGLSNPANEIINCKFDNQSVKIRVGPYGSGPEADGDRTQILFDSTGSITQVPRTYVMRADNTLLVTSSCQNTTDTPPLAVCPERQYGLMFVNSSSSDGSLRVRDVTSGEAWRQMIFAGLKDEENGTVQYQPIVKRNTRYRLTWTGRVSPSRVTLSAYLFYRSEYIDLEICYPQRTTFNVTHWVQDQISTRVILSTSLSVAANSSQVTGAKDLSDQLYYWDPNTRFLHLTLLTSWQTVNFDFCPSEGCHYVTVVADSENQQYTECADNII